MYPQSQSHCDSVHTSETYSLELYSKAPLATDMSKTPDSTSLNMAALLTSGQHICGITRVRSSQGSYT